MKDQRSEIRSAPSKSRRKTLISAGEFFFDLIFYGLPQLPRLGEELVTDNFAFELGGGAFTTAATAARLGCKVELATVLGTSPLDDFALKKTKALGIGSRLLWQASGAMAGLSVAVSLPSDRYFLTAPGANRKVEQYLLSPAMRRTLTTAGHVHFALSPTTWAPFSDLVQRLKENNVTTSWDLGWHPEAACQPGFRRLYDQLDLVLLNKMELMRYSGKSNVLEASRSWANAGTLVVKLGRAGAMAISGGKVYRSKGFPVSAVETTGAGDGFNGGFLHTWLETGDLQMALRAGNACGALSTTKPGGSAGAPTGAQLRRFLKEAR